MEKVELIEINGEIGLFLQNSIINHLMALGIKEGDSLQVIENDKSIELTK